MGRILTPHYRVVPELNVKGLSNITTYNKGHEQILGI